MGLFGGTFDPPHLGHLRAVATAWATGRFDVIVVTVAGSPYKKLADDVSASPHRLAMTRAAFAEISYVEVDDREVRRGGPTYTIDTVRALRAEGNEVTLIVGADAFAGVAGWHEASELATLVDVVVVPRSGIPVQAKPPWRVHVLDMEPVDLSSTQVRAALTEGKNPENYVPESVIPWLTNRDG